MSKIIKGYKAMNSDMTCKGFKFKVGNTYETDSIDICKKGFHFCIDPFNVYNYYPKSSDTVICEIEATGKVETEEDKSVTDKIKIVKQLTEKEIIDIWIKQTNSGNGNSGDWNSGNRNSGNRNSGNRNSGYGNSGYGNSGNRNSGYGNSGYGNSGYGNSGYGNSGNRNSGDWNSGNRLSGYFNTTIPIYLFNKPSDMKYTEEFEDRIRSLKVKPIQELVYEASMTDKEKSDHPASKTTGGFLRKTGGYDWRYLTEDDKTFIKNLPNFDDAIFKEITGISLSDGIEVTINGEIKLISKAKAKELGLIE